MQVCGEVVLVSCCVERNRNDLHIIRYSVIYSVLFMKVKHLLLSIFFVVFVVRASAQSKIGDNPAVIQPSSILELESLSKGFRLSRITLNDVHIWTLDGTPVSGMLIFNETGIAPKGMYYWSMDLSQWVSIVNSKDLAALITTGTTVSNTSVDNKLTTTVNGIIGLGADIINNNSLSIVNGVLTSTVNGVVSSPGLNLISSVDNGLSSGNGTAQLGGPLIKPTTLSASSTNTLSIKGLENGNVSTDSLLVVAANTGVIRKISTSVLTNDVYKSVVLATSNGQKRFATPAIITELRKIQVYLNGISVEFAQVDDTHIDLETEAACFVDDEIKIIQLK